MGIVAASALILALVLGVAGLLQRRRKRLLALLGVACSLLLFAALHAQVELGDLGSGVTAFFTEPPPKVHIVSPGDD